MDKVRIFVDAVIFLLVTVYQDLKISAITSLIPIYCNFLAVPPVQRELLRKSGCLLLRRRGEKFSFASDSIFIGGSGIGEEDVYLL